MRLTSGAQSRAIQSSSARRPATRRPARSKADRTSTSRSWKMPLASSRPPGASTAASWGARSTSNPAIRLATTMSNVRGSASGTLPRRAAMTCASPFSAAFRRVASTASGSVSTASTEPAPSRPAARARMPEPLPMSRTDAPWTNPASAHASIPARHSRVVGCSPVPKAIPGSSAMTTSPEVGRCSRHVGRMTSRRPTRSTGKCSFQASAQSSSWTTRVCSSPIGRSSNACRWPSARRTRSTAASTARGSSAGR